MKIEHDDDCGSNRGLDCDCNAGEANSFVHSEPIAQKPAEPVSTRQEHDDDCAYFRGLGCDCGVDE